MGGCLPQSCGPDVHELMREILLEPEAKRLVLRVQPFPNLGAQIFLRPQVLEVAGTTASSQDVWEL